MQLKVKNHFFFIALIAALVTFPVPVSVLFSTSLITPTATVYFISLTANLPRGGKALNYSTHIGLLGTSLTIAASPYLINFGSSSIKTPDLLSTFCLIYSNLQAIWAVWQSRTGQYPA